MNSVYEEYMRNVLGYKPINYRNTYESDFNEFSNMITSQQIEQNNNFELENYYPDIYKLVYPMVQKTCKQNTRQVTKELIEEMTNDIYSAIEDDTLSENRMVQAESTKTNLANKNLESKKTDNKKESRVTHNTWLNDIIKILILRELLGNSGIIGRPQMPFPPLSSRPPISQSMPPSMSSNMPLIRQQMYPFNRGIYEQNYNIYEN